MNLMLHAASEFPDLLRDESRRTGFADLVAWPTSLSEVSALLRRAAAENLPVTFQGARTGVSAGAVPAGGLIVNLARLDQIGPVRRDTPAGPLVRVQAGFPLDPLRRALRKQAPDLFFAPDPTETSASIGGMAACNASGARSFTFGATRRHVQALTVVLADGTVVPLARGRDKAQGRAFRITAPDGRTAVEGTLPAYPRPDVKNVAGYFVAPDMDLVDLFIGSDGTLGAIVSLDLNLLPAPAVCWGLLCFAAESERLLDLADRLRAADPRPAALEYFDDRTLDLLRTCPAGDRRVQTPPPEARAALYVELLAGTEALAEAAVESVVEALGEAGLSADEVWFATSEKELQRLKDFRHAVPEAVNAVVDEHRRALPEITKIGTDFSLPPDRFQAFLARQCREAQAAGLAYAAFGHIGDCHIHLNLLPKTAAEKTAAWALFRDWARGVAALGGSVAAEHGLGKLKTDLLPILYGEAAVAEMRQLKRLFDPEERLGRGTWFPPPHPRPSSSFSALSQR